MVGKQFAKRNWHYRKKKLTLTWSRAIVLWSGTFSVSPSSSFLPLDSIFLISFFSKIYLSIWLEKRYEKPPIIWNNRKYNRLQELYRWCRKNTKSLWLWNVTTRRPLNSGSCGKRDWIILLETNSTNKEIYTNPSLHTKTGNHRRYLLMKSYISNIGKAALDLYLFLSSFYLFNSTCFFPKYYLLLKN